MEAADCAPGRRPLVGGGMLSGCVGAACDTGARRPFLPFFRLFVDAWFGGTIKRKLKLDQSETDARTFVGAIRGCRSLAASWLATASIARSRSGFGAVRLLIFIHSIWISLGSAGH